MRSQRDGRGRYQKWDGASALRAEDGDLENGARDIDASIPSTETPGDFPESSPPPPPRRWLLWGKRIGRAALWLGAFTGLIALFVLALFRLFPPAASPVSKEPGAKRVLLVSLDGFRADYLDRQERPPTAGVRRASVSRTAADSTYLAPNLRQLAARGFRAAYLEPVFPTKTFPNHQSIITGQYPESHGVVDNVFYDPVLNETFNMGHLEERFWGGEPLWATLRRQGRVTAAYDWPGSEVTYRQTWKRPHAHAGPFNASRPYAERVRQIIEWYERGVVDDQGKLQVPDLVAVYLEPVDHAGHLYGPDSLAVSMAIAEVDQVLGTLVSGVRQALASRADRLHVIVVSDHGMAAVDDQRRVALNATHAAAAELYQRMAQVAKGAAGHVRAYTQDSMEERWHLKGSRRVAPVSVLASTGWRLVYDEDAEAASRQPRHAWGDHGYDNIEPKMRALFVADGPTFRRNAGDAPDRQPVLRNVDVYEIVCTLLGAQPAPNNGSRDAVAQVLRSA
ncbi:hypothetical protein CDCA_CDCA03G0977 [Cyanidium caldarium]|uniref:Alkaline phosphatase family protein n=1 Tax=Cyanidium caldarium TaxID=2771 RepID=A0AAV9IRS8_CYACA|nr:hypothetical protein CDCA_CDCA03G0977 [Cyanidium caldarium]